MQSKVHKLSRIEQEQKKCISAVKSILSRVCCMKKDWALILVVSTSHSLNFEQVKFFRI